MKVAIRADASCRIGMGHVMRCLALAQALTESGAEVRFICRDLEGNLNELLKTVYGFETHRLPSPSSPAPAGPALRYGAWLETDESTDAGETRAAFGEMPCPDWLIVDHYSLDSEWESLVREQVPRLMVIDDLADRPHKADLLVDQNNPDARRYAGLVPESAQLLLGPRYALLRPEFRSWRSRLTSRGEKVSRVFIGFGGVDETNETSKALEALEQLRAFEFELDVVVGQASPYQDELRSRLGRWPRARLHVQARDVARLMAAADLAVGGGGTTTLERCCLGLPSIVVTLEENQIPVVAPLAGQGLVVYLGAASQVSAGDYADAVETLAADPRRRAEMSQASMELVDGRGVERVVGHLAG